MSGATCARNQAPSNCSPCSVPYSWEGPPRPCVSAGGRNARVAATTYEAVSACGVSRGWVWARDMHTLSQTNDVPKTDHGMLCRNHATPHVHVLGHDEMYDMNERFLCEQYEERPDCVSRRRPHRRDIF